MTAPPPDDSRPGAALPPIGYLVPEFPGQTHVWIWRELTHLRALGCTIRLYSTRLPPAADAARHAFGAAALAETTLLAPPRPLARAAALAAAGAWGLLSRPLRLLECVHLALTLPAEGGARALLPLVLPACRLARHARRAGLAHLHVHSCGRAAILAMMARRLIDLGYSLALNADIAWWGGAMEHKLGEARFTAATSRWLLAQVERDHPELGPERLALCRVGVDTSLWRPVCEREIEAGRAPHPGREPGGERARDPNAAPPAEPSRTAREGPLRVVSVGRLHAGKGHDVLVAAVARLRAEGRDVRLRILGGGPEHARLQRQIDALGLGAVVTLAGSAPEERVRAELLAADVFALATRAEALGVVFMEAMACGVATVGTRVGGVPEVIEDGVDGLLVPPDDEVALAAALARLADDVALRSRLAAAGRRKVVAELDSRLGARALLEQVRAALART